MHQDLRGSSSVRAEVARVPSWSAGLTVCLCTACATHARQGGMCTHTHGSSSVRAEVRSLGRMPLHGTQHAYDTGARTVRSAQHACATHALHSDCTTRRDDGPRGDHGALPTVDALRPSVKHCCLSVGQTWEGGTTSGGASGEGRPRNEPSRQGISCRLALRQEFPPLGGWTLQGFRVSPNGPQRTPGHEQPQHQVT